MRQPSDIKKACPRTFEEFRSWPVAESVFLLQSFDYALALSSRQTCRPPDFGRFAWLLASECDAETRLRHAEFTGCLALRVPSFDEAASCPNDDRRKLPRPR